LKNIGSLAGKVGTENNSAFLHERQP